MVGLGKAWLCRVRFGTARSGLARFGVARFCCLTNEES